MLTFTAGNYYTDGNNATAMDSCIIVVIMKLKLKGGKIHITQ